MNLDSIEIIGGKIVGDSDFFRNKYLFHNFQYVSRSRAMMPNAIISRRMVQ